MMSVGRKKITILLVIAVLFFFSPTSVNAQTTDADILFSDVVIEVGMNANGTSHIIFSANVTNTGTAVVTNIDIRIEVRSIEILRATVDGNSVSASNSERERYSLVSLGPVQLDAGSSLLTIVEMRSETLQEQLGSVEERGLTLENMIFYVRPLHEFRQFKFVAVLPQHAVLDTESPSLFPSPTSNHTNGLSLVFVWEADQILPGQERVYIVKYGIPMRTHVNIDDGVNDILLFLIAVLSGAMAVIIVERAPRMIRAIRTPKIVAQGGVTQQENDILRFLSKRGGSCPQREIYRELDMSQSLASMILTGLEQRGLIRRFREGRENMIHIVEE